MSKAAKSQYEWEARILEFVAGKPFGQGQRPGKATKWGKVVEKIEKCPLRTIKSKGKDVLGRLRVCDCGYHVKPVVVLKDCNKDITQLKEPATSTDIEPWVPFFVPSHTPVAPACDEHLKVPFSQSSDTPVKPACDEHLKVPFSKPSDTPVTLACDDQDLVSFSAQPSHLVKSACEDEMVSKQVNTTPAPVQRGKPGDQLKASSSTSLLPSGENIQQRHYDYSKRLPIGWKESIEEQDQQWIGQQVFSNKGVLSNILKQWWDPPCIPGPEVKQCPVVHSYFHRRLLLWMPKRMWAFDLKCPVCVKISLNSKGVYRKVRTVIDLKGRYYLAAEYHQFPSCEGTFIAYDTRILEQLPFSLRVRFPVLLTRKFASDIGVVNLMRSRTLGNSSTSLWNDVREMHSEEWMRRAVVYMSDCERHKNSRKRLALPEVTYTALPVFHTPPGCKWFLATYIRDVWSRLPALKSRITSVYGSILKIDSTKKITLKLQGKAAGSASWCTNIGNERGEIVISVLTTSESLSNLELLARGLVDRYSKANQPDPSVLYTDRDCCKSDGESKYRRLFPQWENLIVRIDSWHFMRRLSKACSNESHPLYGPFMQKVSSAIFEWDLGDVEALRTAKEGELKNAGVSKPSTAAVNKAITKYELARHCRRRTRGTEETIRLIESLFSSAEYLTDFLGTPLLKADAFELWEEEKYHVKCLQDPVGVSLYTQTGTLSKDAFSLPVYRCARGTTSLESFHAHQVNFISGTSANDLHFQAYLLDGIVRWNIARSSEAVDSPRSALRSFDEKLQNKMHELTSAIFGCPSDNQYQLPSSYTGEVFGVEYLYKISDPSFKLGSNLEEDIDAGFNDDETATTKALVIADEGDFDAELEVATTAFLQSKTEEKEDEAPFITTDFKSIQGWDKVVKLARALVDVTEPITNVKGEWLVELYSELHAFDKKPITYSRTLKPSKGSFARNKSGHVGQEATKRCFVSGGSPSLPPSKSRVVEAICVQLMNAITSPTRKTSKETEYVSRYGRVVQRYNEIKHYVSQCTLLMEGTGITLFQINESTLSSWHKNSIRVEEIKTLLQGVELLKVDLCATQPLLPSSDRPTESTTMNNLMVFEEMPDNTGLAQVRRRHQVTASPNEDSIHLSQDAANVNVPECYVIATIGSPELLTSPAVSQTTAWRKRRNVSTESTVKEKESDRKVYTCTKCQHPMTTTNGHSQFKGQRYCPNTEILTKTEWLALKKKKKTE